MKKSFYYYLIPIVISLFLYIIAHPLPHQPEPLSPSVSALDTIIIPSTDFKTYFKNNPTEVDGVKFRNQTSEISFFTPTQQSFGKLTANLPITGKNTIIYPSLFPALDLKYTISPTRLLEEFIVADQVTANKVTTITQQVTLTDVDYYQENNGGVQFYRNQELVFSLPKPVLYEQSNNMNRSYGIKYEIVRIDKNHLTVTKIITAEGLSWFNDPARAYPVAIDLVIDNADTAANWVSSDSTLLTSAQETTIKQEGTGSVKLTPATSWYNFSWPYRIKLTIDATKVDADLTDFPVYVNLNNLPASFHTNVNQTDARDIRVTKSDGTTELPREVVFYTAASDTGELHFKYTGTLSGTSNTDIYIYYGNAGASDYAVTDTYGRNNVWDSNYKGVWHLTETTGAHADSTVNGNNSSTVTVTTQGTANSKLGRADDFDGVNDLINIGSPASLDNLGPFTFSAWIYPETGGEGGYGRIIDKNGNIMFYFNDIDVSNALDLKVNHSTTGITVISGAESITWNAWQLVTVTWDDSTTATNVHMYINGTETTYAEQTNGSGTQTDDSAGNFYIGNNSGATRTFNGQIDDVTVSNSVRSANWISTQYNNQNSPSTFYAEGTEETIVGQTATRTVTATDLSSYDNITYWVRSDRTGSFIRFQFGESASSEQTNSITINSANTWEQKTWNISGITGTARDAVTKYAFYVTDASANFNFYFDDIQATVNNTAPATPSLDSPADTATNQSLTPALLTTTTDADSDYLRYKIELCENVSMTTNCQTFDQTSSQTGWSGQDAQASTAYDSGTQATYTIQSALSNSTTYYWRSYAIDPGGTNTWSSTQTPYSFTTLASGGTNNFSIEGIRLEGININ